MNDKDLKEPYEFTWHPHTVSFSYGNGYVYDFEIHDSKFKWGKHIKTDLKNPTPHVPPEEEVIAALNAVVTFKEEHHNLHLLDENEKQVMVFHKKE